MIRARSERPGPDSAQVVALLAHLAAADPAVCELAVDMLGNGWNWGSRWGELSALRDARTPASAARLQYSGSVTDRRALPVLEAAAERIIYGAIDRIGEKTGKQGADALAVLSQALDNVKTVVEVKSRRVGGATYQVPVEVRATRRQTLAMRWVIEAARDRSEKSMAHRLAHELEVGMLYVNQPATPSAEMCWMTPGSWL